MGPGGLGFLVDECASNTFEEVLALHEALADCIVCLVAVLHVHLLGPADGLEGDPD